jgi:hypothetical protein
MVALSVRLRSGPQDLDHSRVSPGSHVQLPEESADTSEFRADRRPHGRAVAEELLMDLCLGSANIERATSHAENASARHEPPGSGGLSGALIHQRSW